MPQNRDSVGYLRASVDYATQILATTGKTPQALADAYNALALLAEAERKSGAKADAFDHFKQAESHCRELIEQFSPSSDDFLNLAVILRNIGVLERDAQAGAEAFEESMEILTERARKEFSSKTWRDVGTGYKEIGRFAFSHGEFANAIELYGRAFDIARMIFDMDGRTAENTRAVAVVLQLRGDARMASGSRELAQADFLASQELAVDMIRIGGRSPESVHDLASSYGRVAWATPLGDLDRIKAAAKGLDLLDEGAGEFGADYMARPEVVELRTFLQQLSK